MGACYSCTNKPKEDRRISSGNSEHALLDRFGAAQIEMLRSKFKQCEHNGGLDVSGFKKIMPYISKLPNDIIENAFNIFRNYSKNQISWTSFCATVSQYILGTRQEKCRFLYDVFDKRRRGMLSREEISLLNKHLFSVLKTPATSSIDSNNLLEKCVKPANQLIFESFRDWALENIDLHRALQPFEIIPSAVTEKEIYLKCQSSMVSKGLVLGECYFLISSSWMKAWKNYVILNNQASDPLVNNDFIKDNRAISYRSGKRPVEIQNNDIIDAEYPIRILPNMKQNEHFEVLCKEAWADFHKWYGGGPEIARTAVQQNGIVLVNIYPPILQVYYRKTVGSSQAKEPIFILVNLQSLVKSVIEDLHKKICEEGDFVLTLRLSDKFIELDPEKSFAEYSLSDINTCSFELRSENSSFSANAEETLKFNLDDPVEYLEQGYWMSGIIRHISSGEYTIGASWLKGTIKISKSETSRLQKPPMKLITTKTIPFSTGLANIGNTCYMNSILHCFAYSPLINQYFTGESYAEFRRRKGTTMKLKIVEEVENLLNELRTTKELKIRPDRFYVEMTKVHKQFQGFEQHDSHEFLGTLLNSLHEDLKYSREVVPQTITLKGVSIEEERKISQDQWEKYRGINGSVISGICGGQTRNCLSCKNCTEKNTIFEVFTDFSVPIPIKEYDYKISVVVVPRLSNNIQKVVVSVNKNDEIECFLNELQIKAGISASKLVFAFVQKMYFEEVFQPSSLEELLKEDEFDCLYAFEVLTSIEELEMLGKFTVKRKKTLNWREALSVGDFLDVNSKDKWVVGQITEIRNNILTVQNQTAQGEMFLYSLSDPNISYFRYETTSSNTILKLRLFHTKSQRKMSINFSTPQLLTIGSWYNWSDLNLMLLEACALFTDKKTHLKKKIAFNIFKNSGRCFVCKKTKCPGCIIKDSYEDLESLAEIHDQVYITASWSNEFLYKSSRMADPDGTETCSIHDCFTKYTEVETIEKKCEDCGHSIHDSQIEIWRLPDLLIIHIKRFSFKNNKFEKINHLVKFPLVGLDMSFWMLNSKIKQGVTIKSNRENYLYDLYAVVNHTGGISGGHYTSFCKTDAGKWLFFDDERVFQVEADEEQEIVTRKAYIFILQAAEVQFCKCCYFDVSLLVLDLKLN